jgi:hypothetical protein
MKKQPKTIADLKFNWTFDHYENENLFAKEAKFKKQNKSLLKYKIRCQNYKFLVNNLEFWVYNSGAISQIESFIEEINYKLSYIYGKKILPKKLTKFELVEENTFRIHLEEVPAIKPKSVKPSLKK